MIVAVLPRLGKAMCANIGDSRAVLARPGAIGWNHFALSSDHSMNRADEVARVQANNGVIVLGLGGVKRVVPSSGVSWPEIRKKKLALAMTRALGHPVLRHHGVSAEPEVENFDVQAGDRIIIASDGLWDVLSNAEVTLVTSYAATAAKAVSSLWSASHAKYACGRPEDNTTIVALFLDEVAASAEEEEGSSPTKKKRSEQEEVSAAAATAAGGGEPNGAEKDGDVSDDDGDVVAHFQAHFP